MKQEKIDLSQERKIILYMIVSTQFLKEIFPVVQSKYLKSGYSKVLCNWILDHFNQYKEAPGKHIQDIYSSRYKSVRDEETLEMMAGFLKSLSDEWESYSDLGNIEVLTSNALTYLKVRSIDLLCEQLQIAVQKNDPTYGENAVANYGKIEIQKTRAISLLRDDQSIIEAFSEHSDIMFRFPGVLGEVCGDFLRGDLSAFMGVMKRGKTWWLIYTALIAMIEGFHVVFISLEMNKNQILRRFWRYLVGQTVKEKEIEKPKFVENESEDGKFDVKIIKKKKEGVNTKEVVRMQERIRMYAKRGDIRILTLPAYSASIKDIEMELDNLSYYENYNPDFIVIDYADIIRPDGRAEKMDYRNQLDYIWKSLRGMAQKKMVHITTATQASRAGFSRDLTEEMIPEDIRKIAHVAKMMTINQSKIDRERHAVRIEQLAEREEGRNYRQAYVLQCLDVGNPHVDSKYVDQVIRPKEEVRKFGKNKPGKDRE